VLYDNTQDNPGLIQKRWTAIQQQQQSPLQSPMAQPTPYPQAQPAPVRPQQTFAQMQASGIPRPAPTPMPASGGGLLGQVSNMPPTTPQGGQPQPQGATPLISREAIQQQLMQLLAHPSSYDTDAMRQEYAAGGRQIDDDFTNREALLKEEMAQRGLADSSIYGGRAQDLNVGRRSAQTELQDRLLQKLADTRSADIRSALGLILGQYNTEDQATRDWWNLLGGLDFFGQ
jgi:hypothetical protein